MIRLTKGESVKMLDPQSSLIPFLKHEGWVAEGEKVVERDFVTEDHPAPRRKRKGS